MNKCCHRLSKLEVRLYVTAADNGNITKDESADNSVTFGSVDHTSVLLLSCFHRDCVAGNFNPVSYSSLLKSLSLLR